jgi:hypothetical protein
MPILLMGQFQAAQSAGYVRVRSANPQPPVWVVGGIGFGQGKPDGSRSGDCLRPFGRPVKSVLLPAGSMLREIPTHGNSSPWTAKAAEEGLDMMVWMYPTAKLLVRSGETVSPQCQW